MSTAIAKNFQVGTSGTATNNFTWYQPATPDGTVRLGVGNTGATTADVVTANSSGNVGIGTTSPAARLHVDAGSAGEVARLNTTSTAPYVAWNVSGTRKAYQQWDASYGWILDSEAASTGIIFRTQNTERARIDSSGNLLIGQTASSGSGKQEISFPVSSAVGFRFNMTDTTYNNAVMEFRTSTPTRVGYIYCNASSTAYNTSSDYRLKEDIAPMIGALAKVVALKPVTYKWKTDGSNGEGFIAHELAEVVPQCVTGEKDAVDADGNPVYQGIDTSFLVATLTAAIQELKAERDADKATIESLTARITALEAK